MDTADVVIVGAGFAGAATAYHLTRRGIRNVLVLERTSLFGYYDDNYLMAVQKRTDHLGPGRVGDREPEG